MRIVGGALRGRILASPKHEGVRPTSDRVRESLFNVLLHGIPEFTLAGTRVIDLFAGTGALGIEALSRGASFCLFVDDNAQSRGLIRDNVETLGLTGVTRVFRRDASDLGPAGSISPFGLAFLDPPYGKGLCTKALKSLASGGWLQSGAVIVSEEHVGAEIGLPERFSEIGRRTYGTTEIVFARNS